MTQPQAGPVRVNIINRLKQGKHTYSTAGDNSSNLETMPTVCQTERHLYLCFLTNVCGATTLLPGNVEKGGSVGNVAQGAKLIEA
jgi:hypothetical protein